VRRALVLVLLLAAGVVRADEPVEVRARAEPDTVTIGTRFRYFVEVVSAPNAEVVVTQPAEKIGDFDIVDFGVDPPVERDGKKVLTRWYRLVGYSPGNHLITSPPVTYRVAGEEPKEATAKDIGVTVESLLVKEPSASDIRDIKAPEPVPVDWRPWYILGGALALLVAIVAVVLRLRRRAGRVAVAAPPPLPQDVAARALAALRARRLIEAGAFKEYYSALSDIVRAYLEQRFRLRAPEMTTEEFLLTTAREGRLEGAHRRLLGDFLAESDLVKFARHLPTIADSERAWEAAARFVAETSGPREELRAAG
jgi:hypothetical protein